MADRRQVPRYVSDLKAQLLQPSSSTRLSVTVSTLSVKGARVEGAAALKPPQKWQMTIDWQGKQLRVESEVMWVNKIGRAGLKFTAMEKESEMLLKEICTALPLQPLAKLPDEPDSIPS